MSDTKRLDAKVLSQILLVESMVSHLPLADPHQMWESPIRKALRTISVM